MGRTSASLFIPDHLDINGEARAIINHHNLKVILVNLQGVLTCCCYLAIMRGAAVLARSGEREREREREIEDRDKGER